MGRACYFPSHFPSYPFFLTALNQQTISRVGFLDYPSFHDNQKLPNPSCLMPHIVKHPAKVHIPLTACVITRRKLLGCGGNAPPACNVLQPVILPAAVIRPLRSYVAHIRECASIKRHSASMCDWSVGSSSLRMVWWGGLYSYNMIQGGCGGCTTTRRVRRPLWELNSLWASGASRGRAARLRR